VIIYRQAKGLVQLLRPELPFAAGVCVVIGEIMALGSLPPLSKLFLGFMWGVFLSSPAMILNDYFDIEVDRVNAPQRPLPSGLVSPATAILFTVITTLVGLTASFYLGQAALVLYLVFWLIGFIYNWKLKEMGLYGNLLVSFSVAITFILGGIVVGEPRNKAVWIISLMVFFFDLAEEIAADAMDIEGDKKRNVKSVAILLGKKQALRISAVLFLLVIVISLLPVFFNLLGTSYLIIISLTDMVILFFVMKLLTSRTIEQGRSSIRSIYLSALVGMLTILISYFF
jgi:geranylgeranylglycerol-phosphate geranylgeranyltransferase